MVGSADSARVSLKRGMHPPKRIQCADEPDQRRAVGADATNSSGDEIMRPVSPAERGSTSGCFLKLLNMSEPPADLVPTGDGQVHHSLRLRTKAPLLSRPKLICRQANCEPPFGLGSATG
jgi:hypothetical protein